MAGLGGAGTTGWGIAGALADGDRVELDPPEAPGYSFLLSSDEVVAAIDPVPPGPGPVWPMSVFGAEDILDHGLGNPDRRRLRREQRPLP